MHSAKNRMVLDQSLPATITATILGLAAQIEREFISARTKEALERRKAAGLPVGRPKGRATKLMLDDRRAQIVDYLIKGSANAPWRRFSAVHPPHSTPGSGVDAFSGR